jgi:hypothetical protein
VAKPFHEEEVVGALHDALATHQGARHRLERDASLRALQDLVGLLGYPADWADELEERAWSAGRVWRRVS